MQSYSDNHLPVLPLEDFTHTSQDAWLDTIPVDLTMPSTANSHPGHSHFGPSNYVEHLPTIPLPTSNDSVQPRNSFLVSAEDQWAASLFIRDIFSGRIHRASLFPEYWGESSSSSGYPCASNTLQVEVSHGTLTSQPPPYFDSATVTFPMVLPAVPCDPYEKATTTATTRTSASLPPQDSVGCQRRAHTTRTARFHPANVPQRLLRGMRKTWGPAAGAMTLASTVAELQREGVAADVVATVREIFAAGFTVDALMRKMSKDESRRHLAGEKGQAYRALLAPTPEDRFRCRLCHEGANAMSWKHPRDVVRHLRRDHFGLGDACQNCDHVVYTTGEMTNHRCKAANQD